MPKISDRTPFRKTKIGRYLKKPSNRALRYRKEVYQLTHSFKISDKRHVFIFGCQRSGTTLLGQVFDRDLRTAVLQEISSITSDVNDTLRLKPLSEVKEILKGFRAPLIIAKPLVESHNADKIIKEIPQAKGLWMFRNYKDVVASNVKRFSSQEEGLRMAITGDPPSWRSERVSDSTMAIRKKFYHADIKKADAAALGWYGINILFFELELDKNPRVQLFNYDDFVKDPEKEIKNLYNFIESPYPKWDITSEVDKSSQSLGKDIKIDSEIEVLCKTLYERIQVEYIKQRLRSDDGKI